MRIDLLSLRGRLWRAWPVSLVLGMGVIIAPAQANTVNLSLTYTVVQGTCTTSAGVNADGTGKLDFGNISYTPGGPAWRSLTAAVTPFYVFLSDCSGAADPNTAPVLIIDASTPTATWTDASNAEKVALYTSADSAAKGFGFGIYLDNSGAFNRLVSKDGTKGTNTTVPIPGTQKGSVAVSNTVVPLYAAVTCGDSCSKSLQTLGKLQAFVTFSLAYK